MHSRLDRRSDDPRLAALLTRLRELPAGREPPYDWVTFRQRATRSKRDVGWRPDWRLAALAAGAACVLIVIATWTRLSVPDVAPPIARAYPEAAPGSSAAQWLRPDIAAWWLEAPRAEPAIVRVDTHLGVMDLEDSIAWVDELITLERTGEARAARVLELERERSRLIDSLARVRYAERLAAELN